MVRIELPEFPVDNIEVLVAEVLAELVDVGFLLDALENIYKATFAEVREVDTTVAAAVTAEQNAADDSVDVAILEHWRVPQEVQAGAGAH